MIVSTHNQELKNIYKPPIERDQATQYTNKFPPTKSTKYKLTHPSKKTTTHKIEQNNYRDYKKQNARYINENLGSRLSNIL
jgi:hypothetical protein